MLTNYYKRWFRSCPKCAENALLSRYVYAMRSNDLLLPFAAVDRSAAVRGLGEGRGMGRPVQGLILKKLSTPPDGCIAIETGVPENGEKS